jgi:hypothetical protein
MKYWIVLFLLIVTGAYVGAKEVNTRGYDVPSLKNYTYKRTVNVDTDVPEDGKKETQISRYEKSENEVVFKFDYKGKTWAWGIGNNHKDKKDQINNYTIVDENCDGIFETKYTRSEEYEIPQCAK